MAKAAALRRTSGITSRSSLNRQKTPYPLPDQSQRTPNTAATKEHKKGFLGLEIETDEEAEEPLEMRPPREATVNLESKTPGRKRRNLVEHSPFSDHVSLHLPRLLELTMSLFRVLDLLSLSGMRRIYNQKAPQESIEELQGPTKLSLTVARQLGSHSARQTARVSSSPPRKRLSSRSPSHLPNRERALQSDHRL